jgi:AraC family transcriptional regulator of adaptative response / methylphosphotriester-DNA alkyltransferase methyltransferase
MAPPVQRLSVTHARAGGRRVLVVRGEVDIATAPALIAACARSAHGGEPLAVDLCDADVMGAEGMALLVNTVRRLHRTQRDLVVVCPPGRIRTVFARTALDRRIALLDERSDLAGDALEYDSDSGGPLVVGGHRQRIATPSRRATLLAEATLAIERRHAEPILGLDDVAREIATSSRQLQRVFSELAGSAFRDEVAAVRMQQGAALLLTTELPVSAIAERVGYRQAAQFAKAFRRYHGISPSALRRAAG